MYINRNWKRYVACCCSHGEMISPSARYELLTFCDQYKPDTTLHLGDFVDTTAFLKGGNHTEDAPIQPDIDAGLRFLREFHDYGSKKRYTWSGNHEDRLYRLATDRREMVAYSAQIVLQSIYNTCNHLDSPLFEYQPGSMWMMMGDTYFGHGQMYNMQAARDHAEMLGRSCVFGHTHTIAVGTARTNTNAIGYNIGWLGDKNLAGYAKVRRQTQAWQNGFAYGEYCDDRTTVNQYYCREGADEKANVIG